MRSRSLLAAVLALTVSSGSGCVPSGASFSPATGVLTIGGTAQADSFVVSVANGSIVVNGGRVPITGGVPTPANTVRIEMFGFLGDDQLAVDPLAGLPGATIVGGPGADVMIGGAGDDEFPWEPGDGLDTIEGHAGADELIFSGSNENEAVDITANGGRALLFRSVGNVTIDLDDVETIELLALGGSDVVAVGDLTGTEVTTVRLDLAATAGGGDGQADTVTVDGTSGADSIDLVGEIDGVRVAGLHAAVHLASTELADELVVEALGGADTVIAGSEVALQVTLDGGRGGDLLLGGDGDVRVIGGDGDDVAFLGDGDDTFVWSPGDDDDTIEGQDGFDTLVFNGGDAAEDIAISPNGGRVMLTRNIGIVSLDMNDVEEIDLFAQGGADVIDVEDLTATDVSVLDVSLATLAGTGDGQPDEIVLEGATTDDVAAVFGDASGITVIGLAARTTITGAEDPADVLTLEGRGGDDVLNAAGFPTPSISLVLNGGALHDVLIGGDGDDTLLGGDGDDTLIGGPGQDALDGGAGSNILIQN